MMGEYVFIKEVNGVRIKLKEIRCDGRFLGVLAFLFAIFGVGVFISSVNAVYIIGLATGIIMMGLAICIPFFFLRGGIWVVYTDTGHSSSSKKTNNQDADQARICKSVKEIERMILEDAERHKIMIAFAEKCK